MFSLPLDDFHCYPLPLVWVVWVILTAACCVIPGYGYCDSDALVRGSCLNIHIRRRWFCLTKHTFTTSCFKRRSWRVSSAGAIFLFLAQPPYERYSMRMTFDIENDIGALSLR